MRQMRNNFFASLQRFAILTSPTFKNTKREICRSILWVNCKTNEERQSIWSQFPTDKTQNIFHPLSTLTPSDRHDFLGEEEFQKLIRESDNKPTPWWPNPVLIRLTRERAFQLTLMTASGQSKVIKGHQRSNEHVLEISDSVGMSGRFKSIIKFTLS